MESTTNYNLFKKHEGNREHIENNILALMDSIQEENLLHLRPILVDEKMRVIDGQHRLEAAKRLKLPIFYQIQEKMSNNSICLLNNNQAKWALSDYLHHHAALGNENYVKLERFCKEHKVSFPLALVVLNKKMGGNTHHSFKHGTFKFPNGVDEYEALIKLQNLRKLTSYIESKMIGNCAYVKGTTFASAFVFFMNCKNVDFDFFMKKLPYRLDSIRPCARQQQYLDLFRDIYNFKNQNPITLEEKP